MSNQLLKKQKEKIINLPIKITLTENGTKFFLSNKRKLKKIKTADNIIEYGTIFNNFLYTDLQKLIKLKFISKIEIERSELLSKRNEIIDITKLIIYEILYLRFSDLIYFKIINSDIIKKWNRQNPGFIIDGRTVFNNKLIKNEIESRQGEIHEIMSVVLNYAKNEICSNETLTDREKENKIFSAGKYLNNLSGSVWYILLKFKNNNEFYKIIHEIIYELKDHLKKGNVAEYFSLMLLEVTSHAESVKIENFIKKYYSHNNIEEIVCNEAYRSKIIQKFEENNDFLFITWKIGSKTNSIGNNNKLEVMVFNEEYKFDKIKNEIEDKKRVPGKNNELYNFYENIDNSKINVELGLYYLKFLKDICSSLNINFDSYVKNVSFSELPIVSLQLNFK